ncbi:beta-mannosidase [Olivibacter sp. SDN3]|uniref:glycoside hydrolase family 2 protein n=1 Tax=Olivibacter sp. SDN3 TaxID=2764720 RepID=UPI00165146C7|nr:sugar-binding domain-containing protein [Olivibacter sp. SDN3]QNL47957.1 beta-mannosidase [Olivibacter sp. SDN3]
MINLNLIKLAGTFLLVSWVFVGSGQEKAAGQIGRENLAESGAPLIGLPANDSTRGETLWQPYYVYPRKPSQQIDLSRGWVLTHLSTPLDSAVKFPDTTHWIGLERNASVHATLFQAGLLPDPYKHLHAEQYRWVEQRAWYYRNHFELPDAGGDYIFLSFGGIDYYSRIWLNGQLIGQHEGMFGGPVIEISKYAKKGKNDLLVEVLSANFGMQEKFNPKAPGRAIKGWAFTGGTGVEPFFTVGMWQGARIDRVAPVHMERPFLVTENLSDEFAELELSLELFYRKHSLDFTLHPWQNTILSRGVPSTKLQKVDSNLRLKVSLAVPGDEEQVFEYPLSLFEGRNWLKERIRIEKPKLWWPNTMGEAQLYKVTLSLTENGEVRDEIDFDYGIRTIGQQPNFGPQVEERWKDWHFVINGKPIFLKGINWMPADVLLDMPEERYRWLLQMARDAGIQMIRIWGSGLIETETFYKLCNEMGIMVWQDFPISHYDAPDYPPDVWEAQILHNVFRLRNHPSLSVYNGGNGHNPYSYGNNRTLGILERLLNDFDPSRLFSRTTSDAGNAHVYPDIDPSFYDTLYHYVPFISETGMHSIANPKGLRQLIDPKEWNDLGNIYSDSFAANHPEFISHFAEFEPSRVPRMLSRASHIDDMRSPSLESIAEATQIGAGEFYQILSDELQGNYPFNNGLMPWVFNRTWPVVSAIMLVDGFGQPVAPYYFLKRSYLPLRAKLDLASLFWAPGEDFPLAVRVLNASEEKTSVQLSVTVYDDEFSTLWEQHETVEVQEGVPVTKVDFGTFAIPETYADRYLFALVALKDSDGREISTIPYWPRVLKAMQDSTFRVEQRSLDVLKPWPTFKEGPWLKPTVTRNKSAFKARIASVLTEQSYTVLELTIKNSRATPLFMTELALEGDTHTFYADDNFFWLPAGAEKNVRVTINAARPTLGKERLKIAAWNAAPQFLTID